MPRDFNWYTSAPPEFRMCRLCVLGSLFVCHHTKQEMIVPYDLGDEELAHVEREWAYVRKPDIIQPAYVRAKVIYTLAEFGELSR
jgi:hypothetical protein